MNYISGGRKHNTGDLFYTPTILTDVETEMECFKDEIFGPVIAIKRFKSEKVRLSLGNSLTVFIIMY